MFNYRNLAKVLLLWLVATLIVSFTLEALQPHIAITIIAGFVTGFMSIVVGARIWDIFE